MNAAKFKGCSLYHFWVIKGKPTGEGGYNYPPPPPPARLGLISNVKLTLFSISNRPPFWSVNVMIISSNSESSQKH